MKRLFFHLAFLITFCTSNLFAKDSIITEKDITLTTATGEIKGTLRLPENSTQTVAIILSGAARTDRNGNQPQTNNNSLKMLAEALVLNNIAVLNFDKRGVGQSQEAGANEAKVTLDTYIDDTKEWIDLLKTDYTFNNIVLIGHGEGALIGILASQNNDNVSKFISLGATSRKASVTTKAQFATQPANIKSIVYNNIEKLERGEKIDRVAPEWNALFRSGLQPYLISLYKRDPIEEIAKVTIPILIIQGDKDAQSSVEDAELLAAANPNAKKTIIENMNYVLKECNKEGHANQLNTYLKPDFPLNKDLIPTITEFIFEN